MLKLLNKIHNRRVRYIGILPFYLLLMAIVLNWIGCGSILFYPFYGIEKPHKDTEEFCKKLLLKNNFDTTYSFFINPIYIDSISMERYALNKYKLTKGGAPSVLQLRMYNSDGLFLYGWEQCFGDLGRSKILDSIPFKPRNSFNNVLNYTLNLNRDLNIITISNENKLQLREKFLNSDFVISVYYVGWTGWFTKDMFRKLRKYVERFNQFKITLIFINISY